MHSGYKLSSVLSTQDAQNLAQTARSWWETKKKKKRLNMAQIPKIPQTWLPCLH